MPQSEREVVAHVIGDDGWLHSYVSYAKRLTDAPVLFHCAAGLLALAGAVGSRVSWVGGGKENWPNLYALLLAPSGLYRKSTSVDLGCSILDRASPGIVMDREFSPERFINNLAERPTSVLKEAEFSSLLMRMNQNYMAGLKQRLTELYDCVPEYGRHINGGKGPEGTRLVIHRPALSILAASTTDWLVASITEMDLRSGFIPRFLFFPATEREPEPKGGYWSMGDEASENRLVGMLRDVMKQPQAHLNLSLVSGYLIDWAKRSRSTYDESAMGDLSGVFSRLDHNASKVMALLAVSDMASGREYLVTEDIAERATTLIDWIRQGTVRTFEEHLQFDKNEQKAQLVLRLIGPPEGGEEDRSVVLRRSKLSTAELTKVLETLKDRRQIDMERVTGVRLKTMIRRLPDDSGNLGNLSELTGNLSPDADIPEAVQRAWKETAVG